MLHCSFSGERKVRGTARKHCNGLELHFLLFASDVEGVVKSGVTVNTYRQVLIHYSIL